MFEKLKEILVRELDIPAEKVTMDSNIIEDLEADSLSVMQVIMALEDEFGLTVDDDDIKDLVNVKDIVKYLEEHVK